MAVPRVQINKDALIGELYTALRGQQAQIEALSAENARLEAEIKAIIAERVDENLKKMDTADKPAKPPKK